MTNSVYRKIVLKLLLSTQRGQLTFKDHDDNVKIFGQSDEIVADITINDEQFYKQIVLFGDVGFGESFMNKQWETSDVTRVISFFIANIAHLPSLSGAKKIFSPINLLKLTNRIQQILKPNSIVGARKNIAAHYDLSNNFFKLFLDRSMTYSSALFYKSGETLEQAQQNKYERMCQKIRLNANDHVLEIGCGWGGFAEYASFKYGCRVTAITISREQYDYAKARISKAGLEDRVNIVLMDYRTITGQYDKIISIEMIEAVGHKYFRKYFKKINELLKPNGIFAIQAIIIPDSRYNEYRKSVDWLQKHIFPGGLLPSVAKINESMNYVGDLNLYDFKEMGLSYANTLRKWFENFSSNQKQLINMGFDSPFIRKWEYYLCLCEASFLQRNINVVQMIYARPNNTSF